VGGAKLDAAGAAGSVQSLGDALQGYVAVLAERRRRRAAQRDEGAEPDTLGGGPLKQTRDEICPLCGGAGWLRLDVPFGHPKFGQPTPCKCKERELEERRRREEDQRLAELDRFFSLKPFADKTFDTFDPRVPGLREAYVVAQTYAEDPQGWLLLMGGYGTGKTHLAAGIAHERLAAGSSVYFAVVPELLDHLRAAFAPGSEVTYDDMFDKVREVELLVLDDLGAENGTAWATEKLFQLINYRYNYRMPTVITTNNQLHSRMDDRVRSRLTDLSLVQPVVINAKDYRPRNARSGMRG
jgi:DNA replication protein DnaC